MFLNTVSGGGGAYIAGPLLQKEAFCCRPALRMTMINTPMFTSFLEVKVIGITSKLAVRQMKATKISCFYF